MMGWIWTGLVGISIVFSLILGRGAALAASVPQGAQAGVTLAASMAGSICLWTGVGKVMEKAGFTGLLTRLLMPLLKRLFPVCRIDSQVSGFISANICANFLGLGNAATPMGIQAAQRLAHYSKNGTATNELCRLIVLNTASIQLIPANVAAVRAGLGCSTPFDILGAVWVSSILSVTAGLLMARLLERLWRHD